jgi:hypothetical protein
MEIGLLVVPISWSPKSIEDGESVAWGVEGAPALPFIAQPAPRAMAERAVVASIALTNVKCLVKNPFCRWR